MIYSILLTILVLLLVRRDIKNQKKFTEDDMHRQFLSGIIFTCTEMALIGFSEDQIADTMESMDITREEMMEALNLINPDWMKDGVAHYLKTVWWAWKSLQTNK